MEPMAATTGIALSKAEFDAVVAEGRRRTRHEDPVGQPWRALDRDKLARLLQMQEFAALEDSTKAIFIDQAGAWELMPFSSPSEAQAMWARWYPNRGLDKAVGPDDTSVERLHVFYADAKWGPEAGAMIALFKCLPPAAWRVQHMDPILWVTEHNGRWDVPQTFDFGMCVRRQREDFKDRGFPEPSSPETRRGRTSAAVLEKKLSEYLLKHRCSGKGPDSCLPLLRALRSLNPRHDKLVAIIKALEPDFALDEQVRIPEGLQNRRGNLTAEEFNAVKAQIRIAVRKAIFLNAKLSVLLQRPSEWPPAELERTVRVLLKLTLTTPWKETAGGQVRLLGLGEQPFASGWWNLPSDAPTAARLGQLLTQLGREYAKPSGCDLVNSYVGDLPPQFWIAYALEKLDREQTSCNALSSYTQVAKLYASAAKQKKPQLLEPIRDLKRFLEKEGPAQDDVVNALGADCPKTGVSAQPDPWNVCRLVSKALAEAEKKEQQERQLSEAQIVVDPATCTEGIELEVALGLGYAEDQAHHAACKRMPSNRKKSIVALSFIRQDHAIQADEFNDSGEYDLDVLIIQSETGELLRHLHLDKVYASDAWRFSGIAIDTSRYNLAPRVRAFGVRATNASSSRASPGGETTLSLYVEEGKTIRQVLSGLVVGKTGGEWDTQCAGHFSQTDRTIKMGRPVNKGFADLIVTSTTINTENRMIEDECNEVSQKPITAQFTLRYDGKAYVIPPELRGLQ
ncbi:MAG TPA: hypothetical protein VGJ57_11100 [Nitrospirales bacterium]